MATHLNLNDRAPDFELVDGKGEAHQLRDYRGQPVVLVFYPQDFSAVCTEEHACFVDVLKDIERAEAQVLGISIDHRFAHAAFAKQQGIAYPLLADFHPKGEVGQRYGVYLDENGFNARTTFVIDPEGRICFIQENETSAVPDIEEVLEAVREAG